MMSKGTQAWKVIKKEANKQLKMQSPFEEKLDEATNNENWGTSNTVLGELASATSSYELYPIIIRKIWTGLAEKPEKWRRIYKSLTLLETCIIKGSHRVADDARDGRYRIDRLMDFQFKEEGREKGEGIRTKAKTIIALLTEPNKLQEAREQAKDAHGKYGGSGGTGQYKGFGSDSAYSGGGGGGGYGGSGGGGGGSSRMEGIGPGSGKMQGFGSDSVNSPGRGGGGYSSRSGGRGSYDAYIPKSKTKETVGDESTKSGPTVSQNGKIAISSNRVPQKSKRVAEAEQAAPAPAPTFDLLGGDSPAAKQTTSGGGDAGFADFGAFTDSAPAAAPAQASNGGGFADFADFTSAGSPAKKQATGGGGGGLLDMGTAPAPTPAATMPQQPAQPKHAGSFSAFDALGPAGGMNQGMGMQGGMGMPQNNMMMGGQMGGMQQNNMMGMQGSYMGGMQQPNPMMMQQQNMMMQQNQMQQQNMMGGGMGMGMGMQQNQQGMMGNQMQAPQQFKAPPPQQPPKKDPMDDIFKF